MNSEQKQPVEKQNFRDASLTDRGIDDYIKDLDISEEELKDPNMRILDLGSGIQQELSRQSKERGYESKIVSVDPKLSLSLEKDLSKLEFSGDRLKRIQARKNLPDDTLAAVAQDLPFKDNSFDRVFAMWSVPGYIQDPQEIRVVLKEMIRVVKDGGIVKAYPLLDEQAPIIRDFLADQPDLEFFIDETRDLLAIKKIKK